MPGSASTAGSAAGSSTRECSRRVLLPAMPTLFPYTTLFRSAADRDRPARRPPPGAPAGDGRGADRKSTRLNSSHTVISYAVFCLKKKKRENLLYAVEAKNVMRSDVNSKYATYTCRCTTHHIL